jgi:hypothetical protein
MQIEKQGRAIASMDDWKLYAPPKADKHWVAGRSAMECARSWFCDGAPAVPEEISALLNSHPHTRGTQILKVIPEHRIAFDQLPGEPRNTDLAILGRNADGPVAISVEAKADESFDETVERLAAATIDQRAHGQNSNLLSRIEHLASAILPRPGRGLPRLGEIRYQLLTATGGALAWAVDQGASSAVLIVHEFITDATSDRRHKSNARDFDRFVSRLSAGAVSTIEPGKLAGPFTVLGAPLFDVPPSLYLGKAMRSIRTSSS